MKVALSGMVLGASMLGANAVDFNFGNDANEHPRVLTFENNAVSQTASIDTISCIKQHASGDADESYADFDPGTSATKPADITEFEAGSKLAYKCGLGGSNDVDIVFDGEYDDSEGDCTTGTISVSMDSEDATPDKDYAPTITSTVTFGCRKKKAFQVGSVSASIELSLKNILSTEASNLDLNADSAGLDRQAQGKVWEKQWTPSFDLGFAEPIQFYYESPGCENCLGALKTSAPHSRGAANGGVFHATADVATALTQSDGSAWHQNPTYYSMGACSGATHTLSASQTITQKAACGGTNTASTGGNGLLEAVQCPFDTISRPLGTSAAVDSCLAVGDALVMSAVCNSADYTAALDYKLGDGTTDVSLKFADASFLAQAPPTGNFELQAGALTSDLPVGASVARTLSLNVLSGAYSLSVSDSKGVSVSVAQANNGSIPFTLPARGSPGTTYTLKGLVKLQQGCQVKEETFGTVDANDVTFAAGGAASISKSACPPAGGAWAGWAATGGAGSAAPTSIVGNKHGLTIADVHYCPAGDSVEDCRIKIRNDVDLSSPTSNMLIERHTGNSILELCDEVETGAIGGVLTFGSPYIAVPIKCPGPCATSEVGDLVLDWSSEFTVSLSDNAQVITAAQANSAYTGEQASDVKLSYLHSANSCQASGAVTGAITPKCSILKADGSSDLDSLVKVTDMQALLQLCGATQDVEPSAFLIQSFVVTLKNGDQLKFCNSKKLSLEIDEMQDSSSDTITVSASTVAATDPIESQLQFAGYSDDDCAEGQQRLVVVIETDKSLLAISGDTGNGLFTKENEGQNVKFFSACADPCLQTVDGVVHSLTATAQATGAEDLTIAVDVQVTGTSCAVDQTAARGSVDLELFGVAKDAGCSAARLSAPEVLVSDICAALTPSGFGSSKLTVLDQTFSLQFGDEPALEIAQDFFVEGSSLGAGDVERVSADSAAMNIPANSAYGTYTLTVYWEQGLSGGRRLLRSTHVFGVGDHEAKSSLVILPASAQIEDAVESLDAHETQGETTTAAPDAAEEESGLPGGIIALIVAGGILLVAGTGAVVTGRLSLKKNRLQNPARAGYSAVRRSERFSTMNF